MKIFIVCCLFLTTGIWAQNQLVDQTCLGCICSAASNCDTKAGCGTEVCGPFKITKPYWIDSGEPSVDNQSADADAAYRNCAKDLYCAASSVQGYMEKYKADCNNDGKIDCDDFVLIHKFGGGGCSGAVLTGVYRDQYLTCKAYVNAQLPP